MSVRAGKYQVCGVRKFVQLKEPKIYLFLKQKSLNVFYDVLIIIYDQFRCELIYVYHRKHSIFVVEAKCAGVGAAKFSKDAHVRCGSVWSKSVRVGQNWLHTNTLASTNHRVNGPRLTFFDRLGC